MAAKEKTLDKLEKLQKLYQLRGYGSELVERTLDKIIAQEIAAAQRDAADLPNKLQRFEAQYEMSMSQSGWNRGEVIALLSLIVAVAAFATPEIRCFFRLQSESCPSTRTTVSPSPPAQVNPSPPATVSYSQTATLASEVGAGYSAPCSQPLGCCRERK